MRSSWVNQVGFKPKGTDTETQEEGPVKTEAEVRGMGLRAQERGGWPAATGSRRGLEQILPWVLQKEPAC